MLRAGHCHLCSCLGARESRPGTLADSRRCVDVALGAAWPDSWLVNLEYDGAMQMPAAWACHTGSAASERRILPACRPTPLCSTSATAHGSQGVLTFATTTSLRAPGLSRHLRNKSTCCPPNYIAYFKHAQAAFICSHRTLQHVDISIDVNVLSIARSTPMARSAPKCLQDGPRTGRRALALSAPR